MSRYGSLININPSGIKEKRKNVVWLNGRDKMGHNSNSQESMKQPAAAASHNNGILCNVHLVEWHTNVAKDRGGRN